MSKLRDGRWQPVGDRLICAERAWLFVERCGPNHHAVIALSQHMHKHYEADHAAAWCATRQVWAVEPVPMS